MRISDWSSGVCSSDLEEPDRVLGDRVAHAGVHVGRGAHLERDSPVADEAGEATEGCPPVGVDGDVVDDANSVAEALGAAELHGLPAGGEAEGLTGGGRTVEVLGGEVA